MTLYSLIKRTFKGESVTRAYLNHRLSYEKLDGLTIDIGAGRKAEYLNFIPKGKEFTYQVFDNKLGDKVNFECDELPYKQETFDTVIFLNVMEHIFNYQHISNEVFRITKSNGRMIGFTPFLMRYHNDPSDFFRYTDEALRKILLTSGWREITIEAIGGGPFIASLHQFSRSMPLVLRLPLTVCMYGIDRLFVKLRPHATSQYVLGYYFKTRK